MTGVRWWLRPGHPCGQLPGPMRRVRARIDAARADDRGTAIVEFVFVAIVVLVPLIYLVVAVATVQRSSLAVSQAAREAGRAFATSPDPAAALARAAVAERLALADQGLSPDGVQLRFVAAGAPCTSAPIRPQLAAGAVFTVCVTRSVDVPAVPRVLAGRGITTVGEYEVHVDEYRDLP